MFVGLLDFIFPKICVSCRKFGDYICTDCFSRISFDVERVCLICNRFAINGITHPHCQTRYAIDGSLASTVYKGIMKRLVSAFKYKPYLSDLRSVLGDLFYEGLIQEEQFHEILNKESIFVPIPLHPAKHRERSYNQAEILAANLGKRFGISVIPLLKRVKKTQTQITLKREERLENIKDAFELDENILQEIVNNNRTIEQLNNLHKHKVLSKIETQSIFEENVRQIILVDDVITSGATMLEAANLLKRNGIKDVWGIALAHGK
jgi:competence protein ComFC